MKKDFQRLAFITTLAALAVVTGCQGKRPRMGDATTTADSTLQQQKQTIQPQQTAPTTEEILQDQDSVNDQQLDQPVLEEDDMTAPDADQQQDPYIDDMDEDQQ